MGVFSALRAQLRRQVSKANQPLYLLTERQLTLQASMAALANRSRAHLKGLQEVEFQAFSQWGEDGIIDWLVERLPDVTPTFVEFGVENYREANTRLLLQLRNWRGLVIDGSEANARDIRSQDVHWRHELHVTSAFIDRDNINQLISDAGYSGDIGLLSVDIDGNDYWVWQAIKVIDPAIVVCEYNAVFGDRYDLSTPYRADFQRSRAHHSMLYFGASLPAMISLGKDKGYTFVGTTSTGCNAFFVRDDKAATVTDALDHIWSFPSHVRESRTEDGRKSYEGGVQRKDIIAHLPLVNVETSQETTLARCNDIYSPCWLSGRGAPL